jgi:hypothetical protein
MFAMCPLFATACVVKAQGYGDEMLGIGSLMPNATYKSRK